MRTMTLPETPDRHPDERLATDQTPTPDPDPVKTYEETLNERSGFIHEDSPLRPRRRRAPLAALIVGFLTVATFAGGIGYAIGAAVGA